MVIVESTMVVLEEEFKLWLLLLLREVSGEEVRVGLLTSGADLGRVSWLWLVLITMLSGAELSTGEEGERGVLEVRKSVIGG